MITVTNLNTIDIDGTTHSVVDAFNNFRDRAAEIYDALIAWEAGLADQAMKTQQAVLEEQAKHHAAQLADVVAERDAIRGDVQKLTDFANATSGELQNARTIMAAQIEETAKLKSQVGFLQGLAIKLNETVNVLMANDTEAAVAASRELKRLELAQQQAAMQAMQSALGS